MKSIGPIFVEKKVKNKMLIVAKSEATQKLYFFQILFDCSLVIKKLRNKNIEKSQLYHLGNFESNYATLIEHIRLWFVIC